MLVVAADSGIKDWNGQVQRAREKPNELNYGSSGIGSTQHLVEGVGKALQAPKPKKIFEEQSMLVMPLTYDGLAGS